MDNGRWERIGAASGLAAAVLAVAAFASVPSPPKLDELSKTVAYFGAHHNGVLVQTYLFTLSTAAFLWFAGSVRSHLRRNEDGPGRLADISFGGALVAATMLMLSLAMLAAVAFRADTSPNAANIRLMTDLGSIMFAMSFMPIAVFIGACSLSSYRTGAFPMAHAVVGGVMAIGAAATPLLTLGDTGFFSLNNAFGAGTIALFALLAWESVTSVMMIVGEAVETAADAEIVTHEHWHLRHAAAQ